jgi:hypothetical protein
VRLRHSIKGMFTRKMTMGYTMSQYSQNQIQQEVLQPQVQQILIEIDLNKVVRQVAKITKTEYFQQLQLEVECLRGLDHFGF